MNFKEYLNEVTEPPRFTLYKLNPNTGQVSNREEVNSSELTQLLMKKKYVNIRVVKNDEKYIDYTDDGTSVYYQPTQAASVTIKSGKHVFKKTTDLTSDQAKKVFKPFVGDLKRGK